MTNLLACTLGILCILIHAITTNIAINISRKNDKIR